MGSVALELDGILFPGKGGGRHDLNVVFPELSRTDPKTEAETIGLLKVAGAISTETAVRRANPDWDDAAISEEAQHTQGTQEADQPADLFIIDRVDNQGAASADLRQQWPGDARVAQISGRRPAIARRHLPPRSPSEPHFDSLSKRPVGVPDDALAALISKPVQINPAQPND
jgi:hypothetical protein